MAMQAEHIVVPSKAIDKTESRHSIAERSLTAATSLNVIHDRAHQLQDILQTRLAQHVQKRVGGDKRMMEHWVWEFARQNICLVAAAMVRMGHVVDDIEVAKWNSDASLLQSTGDNTFVMAATNEILDLEGCYLFYNKVTNDHIWSGRP